MFFGVIVIIVIIVIIINIIIIVVIIVIGEQVANQRVEGVFPLVERKTVGDLVLGTIAGEHDQTDVVFELLLVGE